MQAEVEAKFLDANHDNIRARLQELGAVCRQPMRLMRRVIIETPEMIAQKGFVRVRDEGDKVTMTYKQFDELTVDGAKEIEIIVSDFEQAVALLAMAGLPYKSLQESKRETWMLGTAEVVLDEWPWLAPYIEIEAVDEKTVRSIAIQLGYGWEDAVFGDVMAAYRSEYPHLDMTDTVATLQNVRFDDPMPDLLVPS